MSEFCVMGKGAIMAVSSPRLIWMATGKQCDGEELGGWRVHAETIIPQGCASTSTPCRTIHAQHQLLEHATLLHQAARPPLLGAMRCPSEIARVRQCPAPARGCAQR